MSLQKNVASQVVTFCLVNATTGAALSGATVTCVVCLDGTQSASAGTGPTSLGTGQYKYVPSQAETNGTSVGFGFTAANAVPANIHCFTIGQDPTAGTLKSDLTTIKTQTVTCAAGVTVPATIASATNITAATGIDVTKWAGTTVSVPTVAGVPNVNAKTWNDLTTVALPLVPTTAGRTLDVSAGGEAGLDWANVGAPTTSLALTGTTIAVTQKVDVDTIKTNPVVNAGTITFPTTATLASTTNITAGTITTATTATNLTNAPTVGDFTAAMKTSIGTAVAASAVLSVTGNVGGNVVGSVASVTAAVSITTNAKKNQALAKFMFLMTDSTNHAPSTGLTVTCTRSIDGGAFGAGTLANVAELSNGIYMVDFGAGDLNGNVIVLRATAASSDDTFERIVTFI